MTSQDNNKKPSPKLTFIPIASAIAQSPFEKMDDGASDHGDSIESFLVSKGRNQSPAVALKPSVSNEEDAKNSDSSSDDDDDSDGLVEDNKSETSSEDDDDDDKDDDVPLIPTDPNLVGLTEVARIKKLSCLLSSKIKDMRLHCNHGEHFLNLDLGFSNHAGVDFLTLTKRAVDPGIKRRRLDESGNSIEVIHTDKSWLVGPIHFFILGRAKSFMEWVNNRHHIALNGHPTTKQVGDYYHPWLLSVVYPGFGLSTDDVPLPGESD